MFRKNGRRLTYANVTATLALVFAMTGGAYAASKYIITSSKQISPKVLKQLVGKTGATGPSGPAGPSGATGPTGANGATGAVGQGVEGKVGKEGKEGKTGPQGEEGETGKEGKQGVQGIEGKEGSPWTAGGVLPPSQTETGMWGVASPPAVYDEGHIEHAVAPISFTIPLRSALPEANIHIIAAGEKGAGAGTCPTTSSYEKPEAEPGNLCIFVRAEISGGEIGLVPGESTTGTVVEIKPALAGESIYILGDWAVTAPAS